MEIAADNVPTTLDFIRRHPHFFHEHYTVAGSKISHHVSLGDMIDPLQYLDQVADIDWEPGSTEPWTVDIVAALIVAIRAKVVLETGGFVGFASVRFARALSRLHGGKLIVCDIDPGRAFRTQTALDIARIPHVETQVIADDVCKVIQTLPGESIDLAWVDDDHSKPHVTEVVERLLPKMSPKGIIAFHDVWGSCDLQEVVKRYGGYSLDLPRLGAAGGLGLLQVP